MQDRLHAEAWAAVSQLAESPLFVVDVKTYRGVAPGKPYRCRIQFENEKAAMEHRRLFGTRGTVVGPYLYPGTAWTPEAIVHDCPVGGELKSEDEGCPVCASTEWNYNVVEFSESRSYCGSCHEDVLQTCRRMCGKFTGFTDAEWNSAKKVCISKSERREK